MVTKKRKTTSNVAEAAREYTPSSAKAKPGALGEALWDTFLGLSEDDQGAFIEKMLKNRRWREDVMDIAAVMVRRNNPKRPFEEFIAELEAERQK